VSYPDNVSEYWFHNYYRVLVIDRGDGLKILSVDVYRRGWFFDKYDSKCVDQNYCLLYAYIDNPKTMLNKVVVEKIIVTGVKARDTYETINVRWFIRGDLTYSVVEEIFYASWELIGCRGPRENPWFHGCYSENN